MLEVEGFEPIRKGHLAKRKLHFVAALLSQTAFFKLKSCPFYHSETRSGNSMQEGNDPTSYSFTRCKRSAFSTTETELNAIAAPASHGARKPAAAIGMPITL